MRSQLVEGTEDEGLFQVQRWTKSNPYVIGLSNLSFIPLYSALSLPFLVNCHFTEKSVHIFPS
jgi:hypothetical protein